MRYLCDCLEAATLPPLPSFPRSTFDIARTRMCIDLLYYLSLNALHCIVLIHLSSSYKSISDPFIHPQNKIYVFFFFVCTRARTERTLFFGSWFLSFAFSFNLISSFCSLLACRIEIFDTVELSAIIVHSRNTIIELYKRRSSLCDGK